MKTKLTLKTMLALLFGCALILPVAAHAQTDAQPDETPDRTEPDRPEAAISEEAREVVAAWRETQRALVEEYSALLADEDIDEAERAAILAEFRDQLAALREEELREIPDAARELRREGRQDREVDEADTRSRDMREEMRRFQEDVKERRDEMRAQLRAAADSEERRAVLERFRRDTAERREALAEQRRQMQESMREQRGGRGRSDGEG